jgi:drug/metabolite transporter (DMT)-like permease
MKLGILLRVVSSVDVSKPFQFSGWMSVLFGLAPIVTGLIATVWLAEQALNGARIGGMLLGLAGLAIMLLGSQQLGPQAVYGIVGMVFSLYYYVLRHVEAIRVALITLITPVLALFFAHLLNGEALQTEAMIGSAGILSGLLLFEYGQTVGHWVSHTLRR